MKYRNMWALLAMATAGMQACSGGGSSGMSTAVAPGGAPQPAAIDSFTQNVQAAVAGQSDVASPTPLDSLVVVEADQAAPVAVN